MKLKYVWTLRTFSSDVEEVENNIDPEYPAIVYGTHYIYIYIYIYISGWNKFNVRF